MMVRKSLIQDGVVTRNKAKLQERERRIQAIEKAFIGVFTRSKAKELEEELHQAITTLKVLRKCKNIENSKDITIYNLCEGHSHEPSTRHYRLPLVNVVFTSSSISLFLV